MFQAITITPKHFKHKNEATSGIYDLKMWNPNFTYLEMLTQANEILNGQASKAEANNGTENSKGWTKMSKDRD